MKKKTVSSSAFFKVQVLVGLLILLAGVVMAVLAAAKPTGGSTDAFVRSFTQAKTTRQGSKTAPGEREKRKLVWVPGSKPVSHAPFSFTFTPTGSLNTARYEHTATFLSDGKVLVAGGRDSAAVASASAELYDPATGTWAGTGNLNIARVDHTATLLPNGKVLVAGGKDSSGNNSAAAELYDPLSGTWTVTGSPNTARAFHTATLLSNGQVLVAVGEDNNVVASATAELYDPASGTWSVTGSLNVARFQHAATLLPNG